jgi:hypothetical protein
VGAEGSVQVCSVGAVDQEKKRRIPAAGGADRPDGQAGQLGPCPLLRKLHPTVQPVPAARRVDDEEPQPEGVNPAWWPW